MGFRLRLWSFPCVASMKALPKRKGNQPSPSPYRLPHASLNESPSQKEGKSQHLIERSTRLHASMKVSARKRRNLGEGAGFSSQGDASMKVSA